MHTHMLTLYLSLPLSTSLSLSLILTVTLTHPPAVAAAVSHWQELKVQGKLDQVEEKDEEDIYAAARIGQVK